MKKFFAKLKSLLPSKRKLVQLYTALLFNANIKGFFNGRIYKGPVKNICTPGLNCYSCPGASGACPLGSLQNALSSTEKSSWYYMFGIILLYGILFGRFICGWLCPFGFIQELLYKIKTPKLKKSRFTRALSYLKYVILIFFVFVIPLAYAFRDFPLPAFCKYICPAGTLEGAIGLLSNEINSSELARLGPLFTWKFALMVSFIVACIFVFRFFCRFFCPLGALYGLFNRISILGIKLERPKCIDCGRCHAECKMDIKHVGDHECISCGECISVCPTKAISFKGSKIILPENDITPITPDMTDDEALAVEAENKLKTEKRTKKQRIVKAVVGTLMTLLLAGVLIYYNFIDKNVEVPPIDEGNNNESEGNNNNVGEENTKPSVGNEVGYLCPGYDVSLFDEDGVTGEKFNPATNAGKITVINFWGTWCGPCKAELPDFDRIAFEYKDQITVIAVHTTYKSEEAAQYVKDNFADSDMLFGFDKPYDGYDVDYYFTALGGADSYPITIILDENGVITHTIMNTVHYDDKLDGDGKVVQEGLKSIIEKALAK